MRILSALFLALSTAAVCGAGRLVAKSNGGASTLREECFALELESTDDRGAVTQRTVGTAVLRVRANDDGGGAEWEVRFDDDTARVLHVEEWRPDARKLVWREWRPGSGRTVVAEGSADARQLQLVEWGRANRSRSVVASQGTLHLPLELLERARSGELPTGPLECFEPLANAAERVHVAVEFAQGADDGTLARRWTLLAEDGVTVGSFLFLADELVEFRWQGGGLLARRIEREEFQTRLASPASATDER